MTHNFNWGNIVQGYESMFEQTNETRSEWAVQFADHASGMLNLIPKVQNFPEWDDFDLTSSMGLLRCTSQSTGRRIYLGFNQGSYFVHVHDNQGKPMETKEFDLDQIILTLPDILRKLSSK